MHLMISHASALDEACKHTLSHLALPHLAALLGLLKPAGPVLGSDEQSLNTPFEHSLARLRGSTPAQAESDGLLPTAAWAAEAAGEDPRLPWALLTPLHLAVGSDQVNAYAPDSLELTDEESRQFFTALSELWPANEGWHARWLSRYQWLLAHDSFAGLSSASVERVLLRNVDPWMPIARRLRTLQNEVQMLLHREPLNTQREARGALSLNSVWISGCGAAPETQTPLPANLQIDRSLQAPQLAADWAAWAESWTKLDEGAVSDLLQRARVGEPVQLTLCGERFAQSYQLPPRGALQKTLHRWLPPRANAADALEAL